MRRERPGGVPHHWEDEMNAQEEEEQPHYQLPAAGVGGGDYKILLKPLVID